MTPQIIGTKKSAGFRSCVRFCQERGISFQTRDPFDAPLADGELESILLSGGVRPDDLIDKEGKTYSKRGMAWMEYDPIEEIRADPALLRQPIIRTDRGTVIEPDQSDLERLLA